MKDCIVCRRTGRYRFSDREPGRIANRAEWIGPCPHCKGTGQTDSQPVAHPKPYLLIAPSQVYIVAPEPWLVNTAKMNEAIALAKALDNGEKGV